jgi:septal ring factor EnvC (AmiA/AmiB activator)
MPESKLTTGTMIQGSLVVSILGAALATYDKLHDAEKYVADVKSDVAVIRTEFTGLAEGQKEIGKTLREISDKLTGSNERIVDHEARLRSLEESRRDQTKGGK